MKKAILALSTFLIGASFSLSAKNGQNYPPTSNPIEIRHYELSITDQEKSDIRFIIMTLATKSQVALLFEKGALNQAGNRLGHVHPLKFLSYIFSDAQLKQAVVKIKGIPWNRFSTEMGENLAKEAKRNNIKEEYIADFSHTTGISESLLAPSIRNGQWKEFINAARDHIIF